MQNRLLEELDAKILGTDSTVEWSFLMCRKSMTLSRQGAVDDALAHIKEVRKMWGGIELHHEVASWVMMAEGVRHYFNLDSRNAWERLRRAHALAVALRTESSRAACAAWMAMLAFQGSRYEEMVERLKEVLIWAAPTDHHATGRASLIIADTYHVANRWDLARPWYDKARYRAADEGDQSQIGAMLFNVATCRTANVRLADAFDQEIKSLYRQFAVSEVGTTRVYDMAVGVKSRTEWTPLMHAQVENVERHFEKALAILNPIDEARLLPKEIPQLHVERAWSNAQMGNIALALEQASRAEACMSSMYDDDDFAYVGARLSQIHTIAGDPDRANALKTEALKKLEAHQLLQVRLVAMLDRLMNEVAVAKQQPT